MYYLQPVLYFVTSSRNFLVYVSPATAGGMLSADLVSTSAEAQQALASPAEGVMAAIALPADPMLWAVALTGLKTDELEALEANAGA